MQTSQDRSWCDPTHNHDPSGRVLDELQFAQVLWGGTEQKTVTIVESRTDDWSSNTPAWLPRLTIIHGCVLGRHILIKGYSMCGHIMFEIGAKYRPNFTEEQGSKHWALRYAVWTIEPIWWQWRNNLGWGPWTWKVWGPWPGGPLPSYLLSPEAGIREC